MATTDNADGGRDWRTFTEKAAQLPDHEIRALIEGFRGDDDRRAFRIFSNIVTYRWLDPKPGEWHPVGDHFMDWYDALHDGDHSPMILCMRKGTKTTWVLCEILYHCQHIPHFRVLYWCNNAENQLSSRVHEMEEMIDANLWLDNLHKGNPDNQNNIPPGMKEKNFPGNGATFYGTSVGAGSEGDHVNMVLGDDPLKEIGDIPDEKIVDFYQKVIVPMADKSDLNALVGTRKRPKDIYHLIREVTSELEEFDLEGYRLYEYPAIKEVWMDKYGDRPENLADVDFHECHAPDLADVLGIDGDTVSVLWPEARGVEFLLGKLARQGKASFVREFCMVFTHVEDAIIKRGLIDGPPVSIPTEPPHDLEGIEARDLEFEKITIGIDPAVVEGSDNSAWVVLGLDGRETRYVLHVSYNDGLSPERIRETTIDLYERYEPGKIVWESNGWQEWLAEEQVQFPDYLPMEMAGTTKRKHSWQSGVPKIADRIEMGKYRLFRDDDGTEDLIDALCSIRMDDNDHLAGHTPDVVMALYMAEKGLTMGHAASSRTNLKRGNSEKAREREQSDREKREALKDAGEIGEAILGNMDSGPYG